MKLTQSLPPATQKLRLLISCIFLFILSMIMFESVYAQGPAGTFTPPCPPEDPENPFICDDDPTPGLRGYIQKICKVNNVDYTCIIWFRFCHRKSIVNETEVFEIFIRDWKYLSDPNPNCSCFDPESIILESIFDGFQEDLDIDPDDIDYGELVNTVFKVYTSVCWEEVPPSLENPYGVCRLCQGNACCEVEYQVIYKKIHYHDPLGESYEILAVDEVNYIGNQNPLNVSCPEPCEYECDNWVIDDEDWDELLDPPMGKKPIFKSEIRFSSIVHPNPTLNNVTIRLNSNPKNRISLKLLDNNGRTVYSKNNFDYNDGSGIVVEFSNFESGVYYYIIESENQIIYTGKIISNK